MPRPWPLQLGSRGKHTVLVPGTRLQYTCQALGHWSAHGKGTGQ